MLSWAGVAPIRKTGEGGEARQRHGSCSVGQGPQRAPCQPRRLSIVFLSSLNFVSHVRVGTGRRCTPAPGWGLRPLGNTRPGQSPGASLQRTEPEAGRRPGHLELAGEAGEAGRLEWGDEEPVCGVPIGSVGAYRESSSPLPLVFTSTSLGPGWGPTLSSWI